MASCLDKNEAQFHCVNIIQESRAGVLWAAHTASHQEQHSGGSVHSILQQAGLRSTCQNRQAIGKKMGIGGRDTDTSG